MEKLKNSDLRAVNVKLVYLYYFVTLNSVDFKKIVEKYVLNNNNLVEEDFNIFLRELQVFKEELDLNIKKLIND